MSKPHVLVLSPHSGIAEGFVRLLSLDGRYEVRRASTAAEVAKDARWRADVVLVDGTLLRNGAGTLSLPAPALVLTGRQEDAESLLPRVPSARGWLRKDPTYPELEKALASVGASSPRLLARPARVAAGVIFSLAVAFVAIACAWLLLN